jgi:hypothetical protein
LRAFIQTLSAFHLSFFWFRPRAQEDEEKLGKNVVSLIKKKRKATTARKLFLLLLLFFFLRCKRVCVCERQLVQDIPGEVTYTAQLVVSSSPVSFDATAAGSKAKSKEEPPPPHYSIVFICVCLDESNEFRNK